MQSSNDNCVYMKLPNGRYKPFGMRFDENYLPDGIWYVRHGEYSFGTTNVDHYLSGLFKLGESQRPIDIPKLCSMQEYVDYVLYSDEFKELTKKSFNLVELTSKLVALILEKNEEIHKQ